MKKIAILLLLMLAGCAAVKKPIHPLTIVGKASVYGERNITEYRYIDSEGKWWISYEKYDTFNVGDTIR